MSVAVLIPWRPGCAHRARALEHVEAGYLAAHPAWELVLGSTEGDGWCKAAAIADALCHTAAEVLVIADADVWCDDTALAVSAVEQGAAWAVPHRGVHRLTEASTLQYTAGGAWPHLELDERAYRGVEGGGITVMRRDVYDACPLDARFIGWGSEDESWGMALRTMFSAPWRGKVPLIHLWHPPQQRATRARGSMASWELRKRYARAQRNAAAMAALIEEGRRVAREAHQPAMHDHAPPGIRHR